MAKQMGGGVDCYQINPFAFQPGKVLGLDDAIFYADFS